MSLSLVTAFYAGRKIHSAFDGELTIIECLDINDEFEKVTFKVENSNQKQSRYILDYSKALELK